MKAIKDGNAYAVVRDDFVNLQESPSVWFKEESEIGQIIASDQVEFHPGEPEISALPIDVLISICTQLDVNITEALSLKVRRLALGNAKMQFAETLVKENEEAYKATKEYSRYENTKESADILKQKIGFLRDEVNALTLAAYEQTKEKKPVPGVGISVRKGLTYNEEQALEFCKESLPKALKLDKQFFEKHAKGVAETQPLDFVTIKEKPTATISSDLSEYLV